MTSSSVAVIGLGNLGSPLAQRLLETGWLVSVSDTDEAQVAPLVDAGAERLRIEDLAEHDLLCFVVPGASAISSVLEAAPDRLDGLAVVVSTLSPSDAIELSERLAERGARMVDAPVSGGADRARAGDLTVLVGGEEGDVAEARPLLQAIGSTVLHVGPVGAGSAAKLANQLVTFSSLGAVLEAVRLAGAYGVEESTVVEALSTATGDTWVGRSWGFYDDLAADYDRRGVPAADRPWVKDLEAVRSAAAERGVEVPLAEQLSSSLADAIDSHAQESKSPERSTPDQHSKGDAVG